MYASQWLQVSAAALLALPGAAHANPTVTITEVSAYAGGSASWQLAPGPILREATADALPVSLYPPWAESWGDWDPIYPNIRPYSKARASLSAASYPIGFGASHALWTYVESSYVFDAYASASVRLDIRFTLHEAGTARIFMHAADASPANASWIIRNFANGSIVFSAASPINATQVFNLPAGEYRFTFTDAEYPFGRFGVASAGGGFHFEVPTAGSSALFVVAALTLGTFRRR